MALTGIKSSNEWAERVETLAKELGYVNRTAFFVAAVEAYAGRFGVELGPRMEKASKYHPWVSGNRPLPRQAALPFAD